MQYRIGEFSKITGLTVKSLRFYHEQGILIPDYTDDDSGYRYYKDHQVSDGILISFLRRLDLPLSEIKAVTGEIKSDYTYKKQLRNILQKQLSAAERRIKSEKEKLNIINKILNQELSDSPAEIHESSETSTDIIKPALILSRRYKGRYSDIGQSFSILYKAAGRYVIGAPGSLLYNDEYLEDDAEIEAFVPVAEKFRLKDHPGLLLRNIAEHRAVSTEHKGSYETLGIAYERLFRTIKETGVSAVTPFMETYLKGPGMIFRGDPAGYRTRISVPIQS